MTAFCLLSISDLERIREFQKGIKASALADNQIAKMRRQCCHEMQSIESLCKDLIKCKKCRRIITFKECIHKCETIFIIKDIEISQHVLIFHIGSTEGNSLIEDRQRITHSAISLVSNHME